MVELSLVYDSGNLPTPTFTEIYHI